MSTIGSERNAESSVSSTSCHDRRDHHRDHHRHQQLQLPENWKDSFADDVTHLWSPAGGRLDVLEEPPTPLLFLRDFVSRSRPCIIRNAILGMDGSPLKLNLDDILQQLDPEFTHLTVDVTPDGYGDCVRRVVFPQKKNPQSNTENLDCESNSELIFVQPKQVRMSLAEFAQRLRAQGEQRHHSQNSRTIACSDRTAKIVLEDQLCDDNGIPAIHAIHAFNCNSNFPTSADNHIPLPLPKKSVVYYSRQNDCLRKGENYDDHLTSPPTGSSSSITDLASLFPSGFDWAQQAFGTELDAMNLWMGNDASTSSMHKDHYENLFYVASGTKIFWLCPPADAPFLYGNAQEYPCGNFEVAEASNDDLEYSSEWGVTLIHHSQSGATASIDTNPDHELSKTDEERTRWIYPDVSKRDQDPTLVQKFPLLKYAHPIQVIVQAGELLYLPSLWFHSVTQTSETIGINYWYDMRFDSPQWCYFHLLQEFLLTEVSTVNNDNVEEEP